MLSVIIPACDEESAIEQTIESIISNLKVAQIEHEIIVINDGSTDCTGEIVAAFEKQGIVHVIHHPQPGGYGHSLKEGILQARYDLIAITDADGTYPHDKLPDLYKVIVEEGYDMVVGARTGPEYRGTFLKMPARWVFLWLSEYATGQKIDDINSGLRIFKKEIVLKYLHTISNGFSFTTTITLAALLNGYFVKYIPINYYKRIGKSHILYWRDSLRSLQIIVENILYYNPFKLFLLRVNMMLSISLMAFLGFLVVDNPKFTLFWGTNAAFSFAAAFIIAAIGLSADLIRRISNPISKPSPLCVGSPVNYFMVAQGKTMSKLIDYETDLYTWALHNAQLLRQGRFAELDVEHLAEELEDMGRNNRQEIVSRLKILIAHLLKWQYQFKQIAEIWPWEGGSWRSTIIEQRVQLNDKLATNPSLKPFLLEAVANAYPHAVKLAAKETKIPTTDFPQKCLYSIEQILDEDFYPENQ